MINLYEKLGILPTATTHEIQNAIRKAASSQSLTLQELQKCKEWLLNPEMRERYTVKLKIEQPDFFVQPTESQKKESKGKNKQQSHESDEKSNQKLWHIALVGFSCFVIGWFAGREYLKYEIKGAMQEAFAPLTEKKEQPVKKNESNPTPKKSNAVSDSKWPTTWNYTTSNDEMRGTSNESAGISSLNEENLEFPYGRTRLAFVISNKGQGGVGFFTSTNAQFKCNDEFKNGHAVCKIAVKFDNNPIEYIDVIKKMDSDILVMDDSYSATFINNVRSAKKLMVEVPIFQNGSKQFSFDINGFKW
ncbi:hypothetical protein [Alysiella crassa]|uniref:J domain-containing protein n=1 Tax=Alysiella crassa TaxID=153491 RepID=A0A376BW81_9NEIS|nr:hypothetical protein [Alysiella crassa]SSY81058.1 Uncharacterised protein [Alysiella crassa]